MTTTKITHYVYKITNLNPIDDEKYYIGVHTTKIKTPETDGYMGTSKYLTEAINNQGFHNFHKEILSTWNTRKEALQEEIRLHELYDVAKNQFYYNRSKQTSTGFDTTGVKNNISIETRSKQVSTRLRNNYKHSEETKRKIGLANKGKVRAPISEITRTKLIKNNPMNILENRLKVSASLMGHKITDKTKRKIGLANKGKVRTNKFKKLKSDATIGEHNPNAKIFILISPSGIEYLAIGNLKQVCSELGLDADTMSAIARGKRNIITTSLSRMKGWNAKLCKRIEIDRIVT